MSGQGAGGQAIATYEAFYNPSTLVSSATGPVMSTLDDQLSIGLSHDLKQWQYSQRHQRRLRCFSRNITRTSAVKARMPTSSKVAIMKC